jgi:hypothetical protein
MHPCCWHNLLQTLAQLIPAFALIGIACKKIVTALGLFWKMPAKKVPPLTDGVASNSHLSEMRQESHCACDQEVVR